MSESATSLRPPAPKFETALNIPTVAKLDARDRVSQHSTEADKIRTYQVMPTRTTCAAGVLQRSVKVHTSRKQSEQRATYVYHAGNLNSTIATQRGLRGAGRGGLGSGADARREAGPPGGSLTYIAQKAGRMIRRIESGGGTSTWCTPMALMRP